jgi:hypothetical protein
MKALVYCLTGPLCCSIAKLSLALRAALMGVKRLRMACAKSAQVREQCLTAGHVRHMAAPS